nr:hypothetical protein KPHV_00160 [Kitasatospora purpeofusca]
MIVAAGGWIAKGSAKVCGVPFGDRAGHPAPCPPKGSIMTTSTTRATRRRARTGAEPDSETREIEITWAVVASLFQFRIATAEQLRRLHAPDSSIEKMRGRLRGLRDRGMAEELVLPRSGRAKGWFLTEHGARIAAAFPELADIPAPRLPGDREAFKFTLYHQLAVVRTHLVFLADARHRGDSYGPFDFVPEVTHRFAEGKEGTVRPDGLLHYGRTAADGARRVNLAFVEVDRATMGGPRLAAKLNAYARYWATAPLPAGMRAGTIEAVQGGRKPLWERRYPAFPGCCSSSPAPARPASPTGPTTWRPPPTPLRRQDAAQRPGRRRQAGGPGSRRRGRRQLVADRRPGRRPCALVGADRYEVLTSARQYRLDGRPGTPGAAIKVSSAAQQCFDLGRYFSVTCSPRFPSIPWRTVKVPDRRPGGHQGVGPGCAKAIKVSCAAVSATGRRRSSSAPAAPGRWRARRPGGGRGRRPCGWTQLQP